MRTLSFYLIFWYHITGTYGKNPEFDINYDYWSDQYRIKYEVDDNVVNKIVLPKDGVSFARVVDGETLIWEGYQEERCEMLKLHPHIGDKPSVSIYIKSGFCFTFKQFDYRSEKWLLITEIIYGYADSVNDLATASSSLNLCNDENCEKNAEIRQESVLDIASENKVDSDLSSQTQLSKETSITREYLTEEGFTQVKDGDDVLWKARFRCEFCANVSVIQKAALSLAKLRIKLHRENNFLYFEKKDGKWKDIDKETYYTK